MSVEQLVVEVDDDRRDGCWLVLDMPALQVDMPTSDGRVHLHLPAAMLDSWADFSDHIRGIRAAGAIVRALAADGGCYAWSAADHQFKCTLCGRMSPAGTTLEELTGHDPECAWRQARDWALTHDAELGR